MPRIPKKKYRISPDSRHAYEVCQVPCLVIQEQANDLLGGSHMAWWDVAHVIGDPTWKSTKQTARQIIAALKGSV